jgi:hypothetical protein
MTQHRKLSRAAIAIGGLACMTAATGEDTVIDAGENQVISRSAVATLSGSLTGPRAAGVSIGWSKAEGPGEVLFDRPHSLATTARFSQAGQYKLMLGGFDGYVYYDFVDVTVQP